jgi:peptidoglycan/xylan/chitin deacetylase (PgdA/CDA1 family)
MVYFPEFFRSPYGARTARTMNIISNTIVGDANDSTQVDKLYHVLWTVDSLDWQDPNPESIAKRVFDQLATYGDRGIILFHDIHPQTVNAIQLVLPKLQQEGYKFLSLYEMVAERDEADAAIMK